MMDGSARGSGRKFSALGFPKTSLQASMRASVSTSKEVFESAALVLSRQLCLNAPAFGKAALIFIVLKGDAIHLRIPHAYIWVGSDSLFAVPM